ncbi:MAG TPA: ABC transporter permease, partial [Vicinamibacterales bacterium]
MLTPLIAMVRKDLQLFFFDRRSVIISFVVPIAIASFFGSIFAGPSKDSEPARIAVMIVDQDESVISKAIVESAQTDRNLRLEMTDADTARDAVQHGRTSVAAIIPKGFGEASGAAFFGNGDKPQLGMLYDPSRATELAMVRGVMTEHIMQAVSREMFGGAQGRAYVEKTLPQIEASRMDPQQKQLLIQLLRSVRTFYDQPS